MMQVYPIGPGRLFRAIGALLARLRGDRRGNVLMIMGLALIPITFATGMVVDYSRAGRLQTKLNAAADAAALSATSKPMLSLSVQSACNAARKTFRNSLEQNSKGLVFDNSKDLKVTIVETYPSAADVTRECSTIDETIPGTFTIPTTRTVTIVYSGLSSNEFGGVLGSKTIPIGGSGTARAGLDTFFQIVFVVDISSSMGIGGTDAEIVNLANDKTITCAFACHDPDGTSRGGVYATSYCDGAPSDYFCHTNGPTYCPWSNCGALVKSRTYSDRRGLAKLYGYKLKIDYVNSAITSFMNSLKAQMQKAPNNYSLSIYTFGTAFAELQAPTTDWTTAQAAAAKIDIETAKISPSPYWGGGGNQGWTFTSQGLDSLRLALRNVGNGSSATARKTYVVFLSDGVEDDYGEIKSGRGTYYNYSQKCQALKDANVTMFSIETYYPAITIASADDLDQYDKLVRQLPSRNGNKQIAAVMQDCASSSDKYFMASDGPAIEASVSSVFAAITAETSRLTK